MLLLLLLETGEEPAAEGNGAEAGDTPAISIQTHLKGKVCTLYMFIAAMQLDMTIFYNMNPSNYCCIIIIHYSNSNSNYYKRRGTV